MIIGDAYMPENGESLLFENSKLGQYAERVIAFGVGLHTK